MDKIDFTDAIERREIMPRFDWMENIKRKGDVISIDQAIEWLESQPKIGRNVDNCYIEPEDDAIEKIIALLKRLKNGKE